MEDVLSKSNIRYNICLMDNLLSTTPHRRYNPLSDEWILISPQRTKRPWQGKKENSTEKKPLYESTCYLCPGNSRAGGKINPDYEDTFVFDNDYPALLKRPFNENKSQDLFEYKTANGICRVVVFSPKHNLSLAQMTPAQIQRVIETWILQLKDLNDYPWVQIFENKGEIMGCSNPHPHGQIWASDFIPNEIIKEDQQQQKYFEKKHSPLLFDYLQKERIYGDRIITENEYWTVITPFWAIWPYETLIIANEHHSLFTDISLAEKKSLSLIMKKLLRGYDRLFQTSMPYSMGWHFAPNNKQKNYHWQLHAHYYPPLLRSASIKKFMVGYEMLAEAQRDITPENAAETLKRVI
jgi:UDPglucose--hexose-1-phosphate uridylyltransferase